MGTMGRMGDYGIHQIAGHIYYIFGDKGGLIFGYRYLNLAEMLLIILRPH